MHQYEFIVWVCLAVMGYLTLHAIIERLFFHGVCRISEQHHLDGMTAKICKFRLSDTGNNISLRRLCSVLNGQESNHREHLGWLAPLVRVAQGHPLKLKKLIFEFQDSVNRFTAFLSTVLYAAPALGLLGTVLAFVEMAYSDVNFIQVMPMAFLSTLVGLLISIPASLTTGLLEPRVEQLLDQSDQVLDALSETENRTSKSTDTASENARAGCGDETGTTVSELIKTQQRVCDQMEQMLQQLDQFIGLTQLTTSTESARLATHEIVDAVPVDQICSH
tara:strand:+ start:5277 stop:6107 length:831 start_codon:yes stop_codon:yes gene_type:complete